MMKNKIRILHVAQAAGGVDRYIRMLLKYLDKEKFENILPSRISALRHIWRNIKSWICRKSILTAGTMKRRAPRSTK